MRRCVNLKPHASVAPCRGSVGEKAGVSCCEDPGDANDNGSTNIADITFIIANIFNGGDVPPCRDQADANSDLKVNIADITALIAAIFGQGPAPVCGASGL